LARANLGSFQDTAKQVGLALSRHAGVGTAFGPLSVRRTGGARKSAAAAGPGAVGMPLQSLERRPDLIAAERRVAAAFHRVGEAKAARLPRVHPQRQRRRH